MRFELRDGAKGDLAEIWLTTANRWGVDQAETYVRLIGERVAAICDYPRSNPAHGQYRKAASGEHLIFYLVEDDLIDVVRMLHNRMDFEATMASPDTTD